MLQIRDNFVFSLLIVSELTDFYYLWYYQKTYGFLMISGGIEVNKFAHIRSILEAKFEDHP